MQCVYSVYVVIPVLGPCNVQTEFWAQPLSDWSSVLYSPINPKRAMIVLNFMLLRLLIIEKKNSLSILRATAECRFKQELDFT